MINLVLLLDGKGYPLLTRTYREAKNVSYVAKQFREHIMEKKNQTTPIFEESSGDTILYIKENNIYVVVTTDKNTNVPLAIEFLRQLPKLMMNYISNWTEQELLDNSCTLLEVLDEVMDYGYPQTSDSEVVKELIASGSYHDTLVPVPYVHPILKVTHRFTGFSMHASLPVYKKNEAFVDLVEQVDAVFSATGEPLSHNINGHVNMKCFLSGVPECKMMFNEMVVISKEESHSKLFRSVFLHPYVKLPAWRDGGELRFIPPDGEFNLMKYTITESIISLFRIVPVVSFSGAHVDISVSIRSLYQANITGKNVCVKIQIPFQSLTDGTSISVSAGSAEISENKSSLDWTMESFPGKTQYQLTASLALNSKQRDFKPNGLTKFPPVEVTFEVPTTSSGLSVTALKVMERSGYTTSKFLRQLSKGRYEQRF